MVGQVVEVIRERVRIDGGGILVRIAREKVDVVLNLVINTGVDLVLILCGGRSHHTVVRVVLRWQCAYTRGIPHARISLGPGVESRRINDVRCPVVGHLRALVNGVAGPVHTRLYGQERIVKYGLIGEVALELSRGGNNTLLGIRHANLQAFIIEEPESLVAPVEEMGEINRSAEGEPILISTEGGF